MLKRVLLAITQAKRYATTWVEKLGATAVIPARALIAKRREHLKKPYRRAILVAEPRKNRLGAYVFLSL